jgi:hypothetical protein
MAVNYNATLKNARMLEVLAAVDGGAGTGPSYLEIGTTSFASTLVAFPMNDPSGSVTGAVLTFTTPKTATAANTGTAAEGRIKDAAGTIVVSGLTVGTSGTDIIISPSTTITAGQDVDWTAGTITHSA